LPAVLVGTLLGGWSCTDTDPFFGNGLIPPGQLMATRVDSSLQVTTHIFKLDSIPTSNISTYQVSLGSIGNKYTGRTTVNLFTNYAPYGFLDTTNYFGKNPVIDSMRFGFSFTEFGGDTTMPVTIDVYEVLGKNFFIDSTYYSNFDMSPYLGATPLATFDIQRPEVVTGKLSLEFAEKHLINIQNGSNPYNKDLEFHKIFNGLYFKVRPVVGREGLLLLADLSQSNMTLFYHNEDYDKDTTLTHRMVFVGDRELFNTHFQTVEFDYSYADPSIGGVSPSQVGDMLIPSEYSYTMGFGGLGTAVTLPIDQIRELQQSARAQGYANIGLHKVELLFDVPEQSTDLFNNIFQRLGLYYNLLGREFLAEYNPILEQITGSGYTSTIDGNLNRAQGKYRLDITSYTQRLLRGSTTKMELQLLPEYQSNNLVGYSWTYGSASANPPKMIVTYTMLK